MRDAKLAFPETAPLMPRDGAPETFAPVLLEHYLFPSVAKNVGLLLGIDAGFIEGTTVAARWKANVFPAASAWAVARLRIDLEEEQQPAFILQALDDALEWGAIGLRRPPAAREDPLIEPAGTVALPDACGQDFAAYQEICNVVGCGVLARVWREQLARSLVVHLCDVSAVTAQRFPEELGAKNLMAVQGVIGYSERPENTRQSAYASDYQRHAPFQLVLPVALATELLWGDQDGDQDRKTSWLMSTGMWRWSRR